MSDDDAATLIEATGLSEWSHFIEQRPQFSSNEEAKSLFMCGFASGAAWAATLEFAPVPPFQQITCPIEMLVIAAHRAHGWKRLASILGISKAYLYAIKTGARRMPSRVLEYLGLEAVRRTPSSAKELT